MTRPLKLDKRKESRVLAIRQFHERLCSCERCRNHPDRFELCSKGQKVLHAAVGSPVTPPKNDSKGDV